MQIKTSGVLTALLACLGAASTPVFAAPAVVKSVTPQSLRAEIARNKGKVVVVNFWATWCESCVRELPALAQLQKQIAPKNGVLLLVSADEPDQKKQVASLAGKNGHRVTRQISKDLDLFFEGFDPKNKETVAFPRTYIYNRKGALVKVVRKDHTAAGYEKILKPYF